MFLLHNFRQNIHPESIGMVGYKLIQYQSENFKNKIRTGKYLMENSPPQN